MSVDYISVRQYRREWWAKAIAQCKKECLDNRITVKQWCDEHNVSAKRYWYYHKVLGDQIAQSINSSDTAAEQLPAIPERAVPQFVELKGSDNTGALPGKVYVRIGVMTIELDESISDSFLQRIMKAGANV
jgi:hypothetical protein